MLEALRTRLQLLCPESCPRCGLESALGFCNDCRGDFDRIKSPCHRCGMPTPCSPCPLEGPNWLVDAVRAPFVYGLPLAHYLRALKYRGQRRLGRALGQLLGVEVAAVKFEVDAIASMPLHPRRLRSRTFNQADEIADSVAARLARPLLITGIRRTVETQPQIKLDRSERLKGPMGSFAVSRDLGGMRIAIVDDVITTGATVNALAQALKSAGAVQVEAWSVARSVSIAAEPGYSIRNR